MATSGKWCCCPTPGCLITSDNFDRADGSPGANWTVSTGSWSISSNKLTTSSTDAYIKHNTAHPDSVAGHFVTVKITFTNEGDKARIKLADGIFAELEYKADCPQNEDWRHHCSMLRLYDDTTLLDERRCEFENGDIMAAGYIENDSIAWAALLPGSMCLSATVNTATSYYVGLATGDTNAGGIDFDDFEFYRAKSATYPDCPDVCTEIVDDNPCIFSFPACFETKLGLVDADIHCDFTIESGNFDGYVYVGANPYSYGNYDLCVFQTADDNARIRSNEQQDPEYPAYYGYQKAGLWVKGWPGDEFEIYLDYASTSDCHKAVFTLGDRAGGSGGNIKLYKNGTLIEDQDYLIKSGNESGPQFVWLGACLDKSMDVSDTGNDIFSAEATYFLSYWGLRPYYNEHVLAYTTVNGNPKWAFGTGDIYGVQVEIYADYAFYAGVTKDGFICRPCPADEECPHCPDNDGPIHGYSFAISGLATKPYAGCTCPNWDGTYIVDCWGTCGAEICAQPGAYECTNRPELYGGKYYMVVYYEIHPGSTSTKWILRCIIELHATDPLNIFAWNYDAVVTYIVYEKEFDFTTGCRDISGETLTYNSDISRYPGDGHYPDSLFNQCLNWASLTVTATAW